MNLKAHTILIFCLLMSCNQKSNEPDKSSVESWMNKMAESGTVVSNIKHVSVIDQNTKTGRVSVKYRITRIQPLYRELQYNETKDLINSKFGITQDHVNRLEAMRMWNYEEVPRVYVEVDNTNGMQNDFTVEFSTRLTVNGWAFEPVNLVRYEYLPTPPAGAIKPEGLEEFAARVKEKIKLLEQRKIDVQTRILVLGRFLEKGKAFVITDADGGRFVVKPTSEVEIDFDHEVANFSIPMEAKAGWIEGDSIVAVKCSGWSQYTDEAFSRVKCVFVVNVSTNGYERDLTFEVDDKGEMVGSLSGMSIVPIEWPPKPRFAENGSIGIENEFDEIDPKAVYTTTINNAKQILKDVPPGTKVIVGSGGSGDYEKLSLQRGEGPIYPAHLKKRGEGGEVVVTMYINSKGEVITAKVRKSSNENFNNASIAAALKFRFNPLKYRGVAVRTVIDQPIIFKPN